MVRKEHLIYLGRYLFTLRCTEYVGVTHNLPVYELVSRTYEYSVHLHDYYQVVVVLVHYSVHTTKAYSVSTYYRCKGSRQQARLLLCVHRIGGSEIFLHRERWRGQVAPLHAGEVGPILVSTALQVKGEASGHHYRHWQPHDMYDSNAGTIMVRLSQLKVKDQSHYGNGYRASAVTYEYGV